MPTRKVSARTRILDLLKRQGGLTAQEIARALGISAVATRKHLAVLQEDGLVALGTRGGARGRPATIYALSGAGEETFPRAYHELLVDLLQDLTHLEGETQLEQLFNLRNERLAHTYLIRLAGKPFSEAVRELARARDDDGYMASLEPAAEGGFVLSEHNCPIIDVAQRFPQACTCEHQLFERVLGAPVKRVATRAEGAAACRYHIETNET
ncbi:MAG TPA: metalloregulator ArsR/SmtB family transcription factor [Chloroflexota bacterium]|nr:metalloregulator ArsR/SmtB family transcription factor [Chloroflexota bacterium]